MTLDFFSKGLVVVCRQPRPGLGMDQMFKSFPIDLLGAGFSDVRFVEQWILENSPQGGHVLD